MVHTFTDPPAIFSRNVDKAHFHYGEIELFLARTEYNPTRLRCTVRSTFAFASHQDSEHIPALPPFRLLWSTSRCAECSNRRQWTAQFRHCRFISMMYSHLYHGKLATWAPLTQQRRIYHWHDRVQYPCILEVFFWLIEMYLHFMVREMKLRFYLYVARPDNNHTQVKRIEWPKSPLSTTDNISIIALFR